MKSIFPTLLIFLLMSSTALAQNTIFQISGGDQEYINDLSAGFEVETDSWFRYGFDFGADVRTELTYFQFGGSFEVPVFSNAYVGIQSHGLFGGESEKSLTYDLGAGAGYRIDIPGINSFVDIESNVGYFRENLYWKALSIQLGVRAPN